jgi:hypothetical protein
MGVYTHPHVAPKTEDQQSWKAKIASSAAPALRGVGDVFDPKFCPLNNFVYCRISKLIDKEIRSFGIQGVKSFSKLIKEI